MAVLHCWNVGPPTNPEKKLRGGRASWSHAQMCCVAPESADFCPFRKSQVMLGSVRHFSLHSPNASLIALVRASQSYLAWLIQQPLDACKVLLSNNTNISYWDWNIISKYETECIFLWNSQGKEFLRFSELMALWAFWAKRWPHWMECPQVAVWDGVLTGGIHFFRATLSLQLRRVGQFRRTLGRNVEEHFSWPTTKHWPQ